MARPRPGCKHMSWILIGAMVMGCATSTARPGRPSQDSPADKRATRAPTERSAPRNSPDRPKDEDRWYVVYLQGQKCGYMQTSVRFVGQEVRTRSYMETQIARGEARLKIIADQNYRETLDGKPIAFAHKMTMGSQPTTTIGTIEDGELTLVTEQMGLKREVKHPWDPDVLFSWGQLLEQRRHGLDPGTTYEVEVYEPSLKADGSILVQIKVVGKEEVEVFGVKRELHRVTATMQLAMPIRSDSWIDDDANPIVATVDMGMVQMKLYETTKEKALEDVDAPELFFSTFVRTDRQIPRKARRAKVRLRLPAEADDRLPDLPATGMQSVKMHGDREAVVTIQRIDWEKLRAAGASTGETPVPQSELKEYLRASTMCDTDDRRIRHAARKAVGKAETAADKADALRRWVTRYVRDKNLGVGFGTASEVVRSREGDCTEHSVLLAAMARAAGLPARAVSGIVQIPTGSESAAGEGVFGYHMWTQVYFAGQWVDIDAALGQTDCDPTHIALSIMPLNDEGMLDQAMALLPLLGRLEIEVLEVED